MALDQALHGNALAFQGIDLDRAEATSKKVAQFTRRRGTPQYDSVVVAGNGIGALCFAARLARSEEFAGRVTVVAPPVEESRRLINGVSLRARAADYICAALGIGHDQLIAQMTGHAVGRPICHRQTACMAFQDGKGDWRFSRLGTWQGGKSGSDRPIMYGARNTRTINAIWELMTDFGVHYVPEKAVSADQLRDYATGANPLLVNVTRNPALLGSEDSRKPNKKILAVQAPMIVRPGGLRHPAESATAFAPLVKRDGIVDVGYVTPFADPLSPRSSWYMIVARVVDGDSGFDKDEELDIMTDELFGISEALGLEADDPEETLAKACVPGSSYRRPKRSAPGILELKRHYYGGNPAYYADGMISAAMGGLVGAEALINGDDPEAAVWKAGRAFRWHNLIWGFETTRIAWAVDVLMRLSVPVAMSYPHSYGMPMWAAGA